MISQRSEEIVQVVEKDWITFPGGELEGKRPNVLCGACREKVKRAAGGLESVNLRARTLCFQCYRAQLERERALKAAGELNTASDARFQSALPFEPVNKPRLEMLRAECQASRAALQIGVGRFIEKQRRAQIAARHALQQIASGLEARAAGRSEQARVMSAVTHAAELQLPESWLPFVVSR